MRTGNVRMIGVAIAVLAVLASMYEYSKEDKSINTEPAKDLVEDPVVHTSIIKEDVNRKYTTSEDNGISENIFKANRPKIISGVTVELLGLATGEDIAIIMIDGEPYQIRYNIEREIKGFIVKVTDPDYSSMTARIDIIK